MSGALSVDLSQIGGASSATWADLVELLPDETIEAVEVIADGSWLFPDPPGQVIEVRNVFAY